jgi:hypothetical protein
MKPVVYTGCWRAVYDHAKVLGEEAPGYLPVRISRGGPRYWPAASKFPALPDLMPDGFMMKIKDMELFMRAYRSKLHRIGLEAIQAQFEELTLSYMRPLVLLCFEHDRADCHRGDNGGFGTWWQKKTGYAIPEATDLGALVPFTATERQG